MTAAFAAASVGCARDLHTRFPGSSEDGGSGTIELRFTGPVKDAYVSINGVPVAEGVHTQRIIVDNVPAGAATVMVAAGSNQGEGLERVFTLELRPGQRAVVPLAAPAESVGKMLMQAAMAAALYAAYLSIAAAL